MNKVAALTTLLLALFLLPACDATKALTEGLGQGKAVSKDLKEKFGAESFVGFNWRNGSLVSVTVSFSEYPSEKSFTEISDVARESIKKHFSKEPKQIVLSFSVKP